MGLIHPQNPLVASGDVINVPLFESENGLTMLDGEHRIIAMLELGFKVVGTCHGTGKKYQVTLESSKLAYSEINSVIEPRPNELPSGTVAIEVGHPLVNGTYTIHSEIPSDK
ncbi:hypothetical protein [Vibrio cholerae]|uniref:ParB/Sulfiredoxin domain-containing protein n=1 Tax=Vibrio cholerae TaxID=666 RepID=A0ABD7SRN6_VIBCL|nr:hypothetical protein [Vibrio cholerae]TXX67162.1 hypothetical protein FXF03_00925 [Vibrio cholerae]GIA99815.1 hypothetical protein VCSRO136_2436 [Vibrio cholerae]